MWILSRILPMTYSASLVCMGCPIRATHGSMPFVTQDEYKEVYNERRELFLPKRRRGVMKQWSEEDETLVGRAMYLVISSGKATSRQLRAELNVSKNRALRLLTELETRRIVSSVRPRGLRKVLISYNTLFSDFNPDGLLADPPSLYHGNGSRQHFQMVPGAQEWHNRLDEILRTNTTISLDLLMKKLLFRRERVSDVVGYLQERKYQVMVSKSPLREETKIVSRHLAQIESLISILGENSGFIPALKYLIAEVSKQRDP